jgi:intracellular septation protein
MQLFYEILPVLLFFIVFKIYGIYAATFVGIAATAIQVTATRIVTGLWDKKQLITLGVFMLFGGMTIYFHNPIFVKWKPTIVFWIFSLVIIITQLFTAKPLMQRMMESALQAQGEIPKNVWRNVNILWALFFIVMGVINLYVAYNCSDDTWVNFKFYGITASLFLVSIIQAAYLVRYLSDKHPS